MVANWPHKNGKLSTKIAFYFKKRKTYILDIRLALLYKHYICVINAVCLHHDCMLVYQAR